MIIYRVGLCIALFLLFNMSAASGQQYSTHPSAKSPFHINSNSAAPSSYNPSISGIGLQFGSGVFVGAAGGVLGGLTGMGLFTSDKGNSASGFANMGAFVLGGTLGYTVSSALGIYIIADNPRFKASYGNILLGSTIGTVAGLGSLALIGSDSTAVGITLALAIPVIGGIIANGLSVDQRTPPTVTTGLLNLSDGVVTLSAPAVQIQEVGNSPLKTSISYSPTVKLLNISL